MRIAIDATPLLLRSAGVKNYLYHWIRHLRSAGGAHSFHLFPYLKALGELDHDRSVLPLAGLRKRFRGRAVWSRGESRGL